MTPNQKPLTPETAIDHWTELQRLVSVGAYEERSAEHYEAGMWPEDGVEESLAHLETWAARQGLEFCYNHESKSWSLEPLAQGKQQRSGECVECGRYTSLLSEAGYCEGCVMQAAIEAMEG